METIASPVRLVMPEYVLQYILEETTGMFEGRQYPYVLAIIPLKVRTLFEQQRLCHKAAGLHSAFESQLLEVTFSYFGALFSSFLSTATP